MTDTTVLSSVRRLLRILLAAGLAGAGAELLLIAHYEDAWQLVPLGTIVLSLAAVAWVLRSTAPFSLWAMRATMLLLVGAGAAGVVLHYEGSREFQTEMDESLRGVDLFITILRAKAPPTLAPLSLALLGGLGLVSTLRDTAGSRRAHDRREE